VPVARLLPLLALLPLLPLLALLAALAAFAALLVLALLERLVAQLSLLADHVAELVERRHHVVVVVAALAGLRHLQIAQDVVELVEHLLGLRLGVAQALLQLVDRALLRAQAAVAVLALQRIADAAHRRLG